jgi:hypothetical protein
MAELADAVNFQDESMKELTYQSTLLPAPAEEGESNQSLRLCKDWRQLTFPVNPKKGIRPGLLPFGKRLTMNEPCRSLAVPTFAGDVVIFPWIGRRDPFSNLPLQFIIFITCQTISAPSSGGGNVKKEQTFRLVLVARHLVQEF